MGSHPFNFAGGCELSTMGATWFVSYAYYKCVEQIKSMASEILAKIK